jgi:hypothetical protein
VRGIFAAIALVAGAVAGAVGYLRGARTQPRTPAAQAELDRVVAAVDRELAADLELMSMFDTTKQAFVLENAQFLAGRDVLERELPETSIAIAALYEGIPATEAAMERRGPAGSIREDDRALIEAWEGDAREAQRALRAAAIAPPTSRWDELVTRLRARFTTR